MRGFEETYARLSPSCGGVGRKQIIQLLLQLVHVPAEGLGLVPHPADHSAVSVLGRHHQGRFRHRLTSC